MGSTSWSSTRTDPDPVLGVPIRLVPARRDRYAGGDGRSGLAEETGLTAGT